MGEKYIIELGDNELAYQTIIIDGTPYIKPLQLLSYTDPDIEQSRKEAYYNGYSAALKDGQKETYDDGYNQGLADAWDACRRIVLDTRIGDTFSVFGIESRSQVIRDLTAAEAIEKIKQHEQELEKIKVGDEVRHGEVVFVITHIDENGLLAGMSAEGKHYTKKRPEDWTKTGRQFPEVVELLEKMRGKEDGI